MKILLIAAREGPHVADFVLERMPYLYVPDKVFRVCGSEGYFRVIRSYLSQPDALINGTLVEDVLVCVAANGHFRSVACILYEFTTAYALNFDRILHVALTQGHYIIAHFVSEYKSTTALIPHGSVRMSLPRRIYIDGPWRDDDDELRNMPLLVSRNESSYTRDNLTSRHVTLV